MSYINMDKKNIQTIKANSDYHITDEYELADDQPRSLPIDQYKELHKTPQSKSGGIKDKAKTKISMLSSYYL